MAAMNIKSLVFIQDPTPPESPVLYLSLKLARLQYVVNRMTVNIAFHIEEIEAFCVWHHVCRKLKPSG